jgi:hypothetical protein
VAVTGRWFDGPAPADAKLPEVPVSTVEVPLRSDDGQPRADDAMASAFTAAVSAAPGRAIVYLTHSTKTGLIAPAIPPRGCDVIVDACQGRIAPATMALYLRQGWPVVVSGSKFFGGPGFSGAVLFPVDRDPSSRDRNVTGSANLGMVLRWIAALDAIEAFAPVAGGMAALLQDRAAAVARGLAANPALVAIGGLASSGCHWSDLPSIFTFAVRDQGNDGRLLSVSALRPVYERLAQDRILLGQPVSLGQFGGLRIAVGARDLLADRPADGGIANVFAALRGAVSP